MIGLTPKQKHLLEYLKSFIGENDYPPSFDEMKLACGLKSKSGVHRMLSALEERNHIRRLPHRARAIEILPDAPDPETVAGVISGIQGILRDASHEHISKSAALEMIGAACDYHQRRNPS